MALGGRQTPYGSPRGHYGFETWPNGRGGASVLAVMPVSPPDQRFHLLLVPQPPGRARIWWPCHARPRLLSEEP